MTLFLLIFLVSDVRVSGHPLCVRGPQCLVYAQQAVGQQAEHLVLFNGVGAWSIPFAFSDVYKGEPRVSTSFRLVLVSCVLERGGHPCPALHDGNPRVHIRDNFNPCSLSAEETHTLCWPGKPERVRSLRVGRLMAPGIMKRRLAYHPATSPARS